MNIHFSRNQFSGKKQEHVVACRLQNSFIFLRTPVTVHIRTKGLEQVQKRCFTREDHAYGALRLLKTSENDCFAAEVAVYVARGICLVS